MRGDPRSLWLGSWSCTSSGSYVSDVYSLLISDGKVVVVMIDPGCSESVLLAKTGSISIFRSMLDVL